MEGLMESVRTEEQLGEEWIQMIVGRDFERITKICDPDVESRLLVPKRIYQLENVADLLERVKDWFNEYEFIEILSTRVEKVGRKLGIFYRLGCSEPGGNSIIEQQIFCNLTDGRINRLWLLCSGFQPEDAPVEMVDTVGVNGGSSSKASSTQPALEVQALLEFKAEASQGSTCALLTPYIKRKLGELNSGEVLEVRVDDPSAKEDILSWGRLSGNQILAIREDEPGQLRFYLRKK